jgi:hypothetical protein
MTRQEQGRLRGEELNLAFSDPGDPAVVLGGGSLYGIDLEAGRAAVGSGSVRRPAGAEWRPMPRGSWRNGPSYIWVSLGSS